MPKIRYKILEEIFLRLIISLKTIIFVQLLMINVDFD